MKFLSASVIACLAVTAQAHFGIWVIDSDGLYDGDRNLTYCTPFEGEVGDIVAWYSYGNPVALSFNSLTNLTMNMSNRATIISASTLGGHDLGTETSFGFVFGSTDASSVAGTAELTCSSSQWVGLREAPIRVMDDPEDTVTFDQQSGEATFSFAWGASETDGFLAYDIYDSMVCHMGEATGLAETIALVDDDDLWVETTVAFETGSRVEIRQSCRISETVERDTDDAASVDFSVVDGVTTDAAAHGIFWYNATTNTLDWIVEWSQITSDITGFHLRDSAEELTHVLGNTTEYHFQPTGTVTLTDDQAAELLEGGMTITINTADDPEGVLEGSILFGDADADVDVDPDMDADMDAAGRSGPSIVVLVASAAAALYASL